MQLIERKNKMQYTISFGLTKKSLSRNNTNAVVSIKVPKISYIVFFPLVINKNKLFYKCYLLFNHTFSNTVLHFKCCPLFLNRLPAHAQTELWHLYKYRRVYMALTLLPVAYKCDKAC